MISNEEFQQVAEEYKLLINKVRGRYWKYIPNDELKQCINIGVFQAIKNFDNRKEIKFSSFLYASIRFECLNWISSDKRYNEGKYQFSITRPKNVNCSYLLEYIPDEIEHIIRDRFIGEMSKKEISEKYNLSNKKVNQIINRAKKKLRDEYRVTSRERLRFNQSS